MFRRFLSNSKKIKNIDMARFETGNWMEHIRKIKRIGNRRRVSL